MRCRVRNMGLVHTSQPEQQLSIRIGARSPSATGLSSSLQSLPASPPGALPGVCVFTRTSSYKDASHLGSGSQSTLLQLHLNSFHLPRPCFQARSHSEVLGTRTSMYHFLWGGDTIHLITPDKKDLKGPNPLTIEQAGDPGSSERAQ